MLAYHVGSLGFNPSTGVGCTGGRWREGRVCGAAGESQEAKSTAGSDQQLKAPDFSGASRVILAKFVVFLLMSVYIMNVMNVMNVNVSL